VKDGKDVTLAPGAWTDVAWHYARSRRIGPRS
jgi:hypothetical protein